MQNILANYFFFTSRIPIRMQGIYLISNNNQKNPCFYRFIFSQNCVLQRVKQKMYQQSSRATGDLESTKIYRKHRNRRQDSHHIHWQPDDTGLHVSVPSPFRQIGLCSHCPLCSVTFWHMVARDRRPALISIKYAASFIF